MLPTKFRVNWLFGLGEEAKNRFSRWPPWRPSWISNRNNFSYYWSTNHPNASYQVWSQLAFWFRRRSKNRFPRWRLWWPCWISDRNDKLFLIYKSPQCFLPSIASIGLSLQEKKQKNRFSRWLPWRQSLISDRNNLGYFWSTSHPDACYQVSSQLAQGCRRSRLLKQLLTPHNGRRTTDHNSLKITFWPLTSLLS